MSREDNIYSDLNAAIETYSENDAIIYLNEYGNFRKLKYKDVKRITSIIFENLKYLKKESICFGLIMDHNEIIPSLILSLKILKCAYYFVNPSTVKVNILSKLGIKYIIKYNTECYIEHTELFFSIKIEEELCDVYILKNESSRYNNIDFIVQTSGTTNIQKVVKVEHHCIASNINSLRNKLNISSKDIIYFGTSLTFDPAIIELYLGLTTGATLFAVSNEIRKSPDALYKTLFENCTSVKITFLQMCPSVFMQWKISYIENILCNSSLKLLLLGGESFPNILQSLAKSRHLRIFNIYGITELSCWAMLSEITDEVNLGDVLDDTIFEVIDENGKTIEEGDGELFVGSSKRICYVDNEQLCAIERPLMRRTGDMVTIKKNKILYKGRIDDTIKRFGIRVDLLYTENLIHVHTGIRSVCIWLENFHKLVLFACVNEENDVIISKIKDKLRIKLLHLLPKECMPDHIELLLSLPLTQNGKIDRKVLLCKASKILEQTPLSQKNLINVYSEIWQKYFGKTSLEFAKTKTFYELGGTSIVKIQFIEELKRCFDGPLYPFILDYIFTNSYEKVQEFLESVSIDSNKRTLTEDNSRRNKFAKHDRHLLSMEVEWNVNLQACVDSTPVIAYNRRLVMVGSFSNIFAVLSIDSGEEIAKVILPEAIEGSCLLSYCENFAYIGCYDHNMYCIDVCTGKILWWYKTGDRIKSKPNHITESAIIFGSYDKFLHCIDTKTGSCVWKLFVHAAVTADILIVNKQIIIMTIKGTCMSLDEHGSEHWQIELGSPVFGSPVQLKDEFVVADVLGTVHCLNFNGKELWNFKLDGNIYSSMLFYDQHLVFGTHDSVIYCYECNTNIMEPVLKYKVSIDSPTSSKVEILALEDKKYIIAACITGYVYVISMTDFSILSRLKLDGHVFSTPVVFQNKVMIGCRDNNLICIKIR